MTEPGPNARPTVLVVMGSTRPGRHCPAIAGWVVALARDCADFDFQLVDLKDWPLPMDDEPGIPARHGYIQPHTRAWAAKAVGADGFVFVTPQYNWGYPAPLKNAIDHLYKEWNGKPAVIVTYGGHGGGKCAAQLRQVAEGVRMRPTPTMPSLVLTDDMILGGPCDPATDLAAHAQTVRQAVLELAAELRPGAVQPGLSQ